MQEEAPAFFFCQSGGEEGFGFRGGDSFFVTYRKSPDLQKIPV
jgi:hypothetical protein